MELKDCKLELKAKTKKTKHCGGERKFLKQLDREGRNFPKEKVSLVTHRGSHNWCLTVKNEVIHGCGEAWG